MKAFSNFEEFDNFICRFLPEGSTCQYRGLGINYSKVLAIKDGKIIEVGEFIYRFWREGLYKHEEESLLKEFSYAVKKYYDNPTGNVPSIFFVDNKLTLK